MSTGVVTCGKIVVTEDSLTFDQLIDVDAAAPTHDDVIIYKDNVIDPLYTTGWHSAGLLIENFTNVNAVTSPQHNEIITYNENAVDGAYPDGWVNKDISAVFSDITVTIAGVVTAVNSVVEADEGNTGTNDMIMFTDTVAATGTINVSIGSAFDNNSIFAKELTDTDFIFIQTLSAGEIADLVYTAGTIFRSKKGIYGFSGPVPTPLGIPSMGFKLTKFSTAVANTTVVVASIGTDVEVTLFESDGVTIADGPTLISSNQLATMSCGTTTGEFTVSSSGTIIGYVNAVGTQLRLLVPMTTEILTHNRNTTVSSMIGSANVTWYRRNGTTGTDVITSGTAGSLTAGGNASWGIGGWIILKSDVPISSFTGNDSGARDQSVPGWPLGQLAQVFPNPSFLDNSITHELSSICIASPYEGTATVYDNTGTEFDTFNYTRTVAVTTAADQVYPAAGRWMPSDVLVSSTLDGGYVICNTPCVCVMNFRGSAVWTGQSGDEMIIAGTTPEELRAEIKLDANGIARRRDMSAAGVITWEIC